MSAGMTDVMPGVAGGDLAYILEWTAGAAMLTTAIGVVGQRLLAHRSIGIQVTLTSVVTVITALASVTAISYRMLPTSDSQVMLELMGIAGLAGLAVALVISRSVTRAARQLQKAVREVGEVVALRVKSQKLGLTLLLVESAEVFQLSICSHDPEAIIHAGEPEKRAAAEGHDPSRLCDGKPTPWPGRCR